MLHLLPMLAMYPWDRHPDLSQERLVRLARELVRVREDALLVHEPDKGDGPWGYGCRALERQIDVVKKLAEQENWLTVLEDRRHFVFQIGKVPVRFYKGRASKPKISSLQQQNPELQAQQKATIGAGFGVLLSKRISPATCLASSPSRSPSPAKAARRR